MHGDRWRRVEELFLEAQQLESAERHSFLANECGDDHRLRAEVISLLDHSSDSEFLEDPEHLREFREGAPCDDAPSEDSAPQTIGPYEIRSVLGEGGMGTVYLANQRQPVQRKVALKIVKLGMDTRQVVARFNAERQALARMSHRSIAQVFDAGATPTGRPYFVLEYVDGIPLTQYCADENLDTEARLRLFVEVCRAVQHAHQRGVIHRDLKPQNVLVTKQDGGALPKIIDFGIAKAIAEPLTDASLHTEQGVLIGTPEYMSPEQADPQSGGLDTRSDVYSLGLMLYEILVGVLPFDAKTLRAKGWQEIQRVIREDEPPKPSTRLGALSETTHAPTTRWRQLRGDLDWITMKALEKSPDRRYASASELAEDIERHLRDEPVMAGPPTTMYRMQKFVRKNRWLVSAAGLLFTLVTVGLVVAREAQQFAEDQLAEITRLSDHQKLDDLIERAEALPLDAAHASQLLDLRSSLSELVRRRPQHEHDLVQLEREFPPTAESPRRPQLQQEKKQVEDSIKHLEWLVQEDDLNPRRQSWARRQLEVCHSRQLELDQLLQGRFQAIYTQQSLQWRHSLLFSLVERLDALSSADPNVSKIAEIEQRVQLIEQMQEESLRSSNAQLKWQECVADVAQLPCYGGLKLEPQFGLLPLQRDPGSGFWEFWHMASGERPHPDPDEESPNPWLIEKETGVVLILVPGGRFTMGNKGENLSEPEHEVALAPYFISRYEMTQAQWQRTAGENLSSTRGDILPVSYVTWILAMSSLRRIGLTLPTEAQWEYAARGGSATPYWAGPTPASAQGCDNIADRSLQNSGTVQGGSFEDIDDGYVGPSPVGTFRANPFGLHDVGGNVAELCRDSVGDYTFPVAAGDGERQTYANRRALRGGASQFQFALSPATARVGGVPEAAPGSYIGVRPARPLEKP